MEDLISRAAAKEAIHDKIVSASTVVRMWNILDSVPAVDAVSVVHARWTDDDKCSECGQYIYHGDMRNYCPNCGAKMDADQRLAFADQSGAEYADNPTV